MIKIVIVDDEYYVRMGLKTIADQGKYYRVTGEADNGVTALNLILEQDPDIVFLDITIPKLDGIEVLKRIRQNGYTGYVTMLTCHDEFPYVQQALRLGANDYVLKTDLAGDAFLEYLDKIRTTKLEKGDSGAEDARIWDEKRTSHRYKENFLKNILLIGCINQETLARGWEKHHIKCGTNGIYIITLYFRHWEAIVARYQKSDIQVFFLAVENIIQEIMQEYREWEGLYSEPYLYHILFTCSQEPSMTKREERLQALVKNLARHFAQILELDTVIAVSRNTFPVWELHRGYRRARKLLEQCYFHPEKKLFWDGVLSPKREADLTQLQTTLQKCGQPADFTEVVAAFVKNNQDALINRPAFLKTVDLGLVRYREYCPELVNLEVDRCVDLTQLLRVINDVFLESQRSGRENACSSLVKRSLEIINANLREKITLEDIAEQLGISAGYFSHIFSAEMGETFLKYLTQRRIDRAKQLIRTTNLKCYEIAEQCGFGSPVHFNNTFKKLCGVTPDQFRNDRQV